MMEITIVVKNTHTRPRNENSLCRNSDPIANVKSFLE